MRSASPGRITFDAFARSPFTFTFPPVTACAATARVLKNRAAHSHLSMRILSSADAVTLMLDPHGTVFPAIRRGVASFRSAAVGLRQADERQKKSRQWRDFLSLFFFSLWLGVR